FGNLREQASKRVGAEDAEKEYKRGLALRAKGDIDGCISALENASRSPKLRFSTSWLIARLYRDRDKMPQALEWLERAAQAPAPNVDDGHQLLYELAEGLEQVGETGRAAVTGLGRVNLFAGFADLALVFASRPSTGSGRPEFIEGRDRPDVSLSERPGRP